jgi:putative flippase GtrA
MHSKVRHLLLYTGVNAASTVVDYSVFLTLTHIFGMPILQSVFGYSTAIVVNYFLTKKFVFVRDMSHKTEHRLFMEFAGTGLLGLILTAVVIWVTVHMMKLPPVDGKTVAVLMCFVTLYFVRSRIVFNERTTAETAAA